MGILDKLNPFSTNKGENSIPADVEVENVRVPKDIRANIEALRSMQEEVQNTVSESNTSNDPIAQAMQSITEDVPNDQSEKEPPENHNNVAKIADTAAQHEMRHLAQMRKQRALASPEQSGVVMPPERRIKDTTEISAGASTQEAIQQPTNLDAKAPQQNISETPSGVAQIKAALSAIASGSSLTEHVPTPKEPSVVATPTGIKQQPLDDIEEVNTTQKETVVPKDSDSSEAAKNAREIPPISQPVAEHSSSIQEQSEHKDKPEAQSIDELLSALPKNVQRGLVEDAVELLSIAVRENDNDRLIRQTTRLEELLGDSKASDGIKLHTKFTQLFRKRMLRNAVLRLQSAGEIQAGPQPGHIIKPEAQRSNTLDTPDYSDESHVVLTAHEAIKNMRMPEQRKLRGLIEQNLRAEAEALLRKHNPSIQDIDFQDIADTIDKYQAGAHSLH